VRPGDVCSVESGPEDYRVVKILGVADGVYDVTLYADRFSARPDALDPADLEPVIEYIPVFADDFAAWLPQVVVHAPAAGALLRRSS
jgi:hypothetical protein